MLTSKDIIRLPYTPDLTEGGVAQVLRVLPQIYSRADSSIYSRLRRMVAGLAVEIAFRRYLSQQGVEFEVNNAVPFSDPEHYEVSISSQRVDIKSYLISFRDQIQQIRANPSILLDASALVPSDHHAAEGHSTRDVYLFAFLTGLVAASQDELMKAIHAGQPHYLVHVFEEAWRQPQVWGTLGQVHLKSEAEEHVIVDVIGLDANRNHLAQTVNLPPRTKIALGESFHSLSALHIHNIPAARIGIHSPAFDKTKIIHALEWSNIWVYGIGIYLTGCMRWEEFDQKASPVYPGTRVFQYKKTHDKNLALSVKNLHPLSRLF